MLFIRSKSRGSPAGVVVVQVSKVLEASRAPDAGEMMASAGPRCTCGDHRAPPGDPLHAFTSRSHHFMVTEMLFSEIGLDSSRKRGSNMRTLVKDDVLCIVRY